MDTICPPLTVNNQFGDLHSPKCYFLNRIAVFHFIIDDLVEEPTIKFLSEDPYLQYVRIKLL